MRSSELLGLRRCPGAERVLLVSMRAESNDTFPIAITLPERDGSEANTGRGLAWASLGIAGFSLSFPMTRLALESFGPTLVGLGRAVVAAMAAIVGLVVLRAKRPERSEWPSLVLVALGVVVGFPWLTAYALRTVPTAHATVIVSLAPLATAAIGAVRGGERPSRSFWIAAVAGALAVVAFGISRSADLRLRPTDLVLILAVVLVAVGYAEGGRLARTMGGVRVISWALVVALPVTLPLTLYALTRGEMAKEIGPRALLGFLYISLVSMYSAFFAWYRGLAVAGIANASQVQLLQPVLGLVWAALLLGEHVSPTTVAAALAVVLCAAWARRTNVPLARR